MSASRPRRRTPRRAAATSAVLVLVLAVASVLALWSVRRMQAGFAEVQKTTTTLTSYLAVQDAIAQEAFAEAGYRRSPSPDSRARLVAALSGVTPTLAEVRQDGTERDRAVAANLAVLNDTYVAQVQAALDSPSATVPVTPDDRVAGPALDSMNELVQSAITGTRARSAAARADQQRFLHRLSVAMPLVLVTAFGSIGLAWWLVLRQQRRLERDSARQTYLAEHDALTGLANRTVLWRELDAVLASASPDAALVLLDLDGFKEINDEHGHPAGDAVLCAVARQLERACGDGDVPVRLGGDEFAVLVRPADGAAAMTSRLPLAVATPVQLEDVVLVPQTSVGAAVARPGEDRIALMRRADRSLYAHKARAGAVPFQRHRERQIAT